MCFIYGRSYSSGISTNKNNCIRRESFPTNNFFKIYSSEIPTNKNNYNVIRRECRRIKKLYSSGIVKNKTKKYFWWAQTLIARTSKSTDQRFRQLGHDNTHNPGNGRFGQRPYRPKQIRPKTMSAKAISAKQFIHIGQAKSPYQPNEIFITANENYIL